MSPFPTRFAPMLAASADRLPEQRDGWTIEPKWDGGRVIAEGAERSARLWTRNGNDKEPQCPAAVAALTAMLALLARRLAPLRERASSAVANGLRCAS